MFRTLLVTFVVTLVTGCTTTEERAARAQADVEQMMAEYGPACSRLGYTAGTDAWRHCVLELDFKDEMQRYAPYGPGDAWGPSGNWHGYWGRAW